MARRFSVVCAAIFAAGALAAGAVAQTPQRTAATLAVSEIRVDSKAVLPDTYSANTLTREVESALDATGQFRIVSRAGSEAEGYADEVGRTRQGVSRDQRATYLLTIEVLGIDATLERVPVPNLYGKVSTSTVGRIEMRATVMTLANRQVQSRFPINASVETPPVVQDANVAVRTGIASLGFVDLAKAAGRAMADRVLDEVFPVQVIQRQDNMVYLNRGEDSGYRMGEVLRVFAGGGARLIDPYTKEDLGPLETLIGTVRVTDMRPRLTIAEIITETGAIGQGALIRKRRERER